MDHPVVGVETKNVTQEMNIAEKEKLNVKKIKTDVKAHQINCERDWKKAEPFSLAQEVLNTLKKAHLTELIYFWSPLAAVLMAMIAVRDLILCVEGQILKDRYWQRSR